MYALERRLRKLGREAELMAIPDAGHVFNFRDREKARTAWEATIRWLDRYLKPSPLLWPHSPLLRRVAPCYRRVDACYGT